MAKIARKTQKIFGSSAGANEIGVFGSFAANAPAYSLDPAVIQSLSNYLGGWYAAVQGDLDPAIEDMNSIHYLFAYQLAYQMQSGIPEWDAGTTYYKGSLALDPGGTGTIFYSLADANTNNVLTNTTFWQTNSATPSGSIQMFAGSTLPFGWLNCNGAAVSRTTYAALFSACGTAYGTGDGSTTFNVPNFAGRVPIGPAGTINASLGGTGGEATHVLSVAEMPSHTHQQFALSTPGLNFADSGGSAIAMTGGGGITGPNGPTNQTTGSTGSGTAHNNVQPYVAVNFIIKI